MSSQRNSVPVTASSLTGAEQRILVIGCSGSGKSTVARALARLLGLPLVHLDQEYWRPGWIEPPPAEWERRVDELLAKPRWVMDGNYGGTMERRLSACDAALFLDLPTITCLSRVVRRRWRFHGRTRQDVPPGCPERMDAGFLRWIWTYRSRRRPEVLRRLSDASARARVAVFRNQREIDALISGLERKVGVKMGA